MTLTRTSADEALLRDWAESGSEIAFSEIVRRHVGLVYHTCLRELQNRWMAEDATQAVFLVLAQKGRFMPRSAHLVGWLFRTSRLVCKDFARAERRRKRNESLAGVEANTASTAGPDDLLANSAIVNHALSALRQTEREAILLRFYDQMSFQEVGEALDMSDDTAQKCVSRALEKMRRHLIRSGVTLTSVALAGFLSVESARIVPPETLGKALLAASAMPGGQIAGALVGTKAYQISQGVLHTMRLKMIAATSAAAVFVLCGILLASQIHEGPEFLLEQSRAAYTGAKSFSMIIDNHNSSGLYPTDFTQSLTWQKDGRFELRVISPGNKTVPNFVSDGTRVTATYPDGHKEVVPPPAENNEPGWEVAGGFILSWLQNTPTGNYLFSPPQGASVDWSYGPRIEWRGRPVKELVLRVEHGANAGGGASTASIFVDPNSHEYVGMEWVNAGKPGYALYKDQKLSR